jgi:hypothetical protein
MLTQSRAVLLPAALLVAGASLFSLGALVGPSRWQRPPPIRTAFDVAFRLNRLDRPLRVLHPAREGLSLGLYFTRTAKGLEDLMRLPRGDCEDPRWEGTVYCTADVAHVEALDRDARRLPAAPGLLFYGDHDLIRQIAEALH